MQRIVRIATVARHSQHGREDCAAMSPNERVAHLVRLCDQMFADCGEKLRRVARVRRMRNNARNLS
jgi:hypothetical protein